MNDSNEIPKEKFLPDILSESLNTEMSDCPFCSKPFDFSRVKLHHMGTIMYSYRCSGCGIMTPKFGSESALISFWNKRSAFGLADYTVASVDAHREMIDQIPDANLKKAILDRIARYGLTKKDCDFLAKIFDGYIANITDKT